MHTSPSGKRYIGITKQKLEERWGKDGYRYQRCTLFWRAIQKYGWENFEHVVIDSADTLEEANEKEKHYIIKYRTNDADYGYNCTEGGDGVAGWKANDEQRQKNSDAKKKMWEDEEVRALLTKERRNRGNSPEEKKRLSDISKRAWQDEEYASKQRANLLKISQDEEQRKHRSETMIKKWKEDSQFVNAMQAHLRKIHDDDTLKKKHSEDMKRLWEENREVFLQNRSYLSGSKNPMARAVKCVEMNATFETAREAERETGVSAKNISNVLRGKNKTAGGYHWEYATEVLLDKENPMSN